MFSGLHLYNSSRGIGKKAARYKFCSEVIVTKVNKAKMHETVAVCNKLEKENIVQIILIGCVKAYIGIV